MALNVISSGLGDDLAAAFEADGPNTLEHYQNKANQVHVNDLCDMLLSHGQRFLDNLDYEEAFVALLESATERLRYCSEQH